MVRHISAWAVQSSVRAQHPSNLLTMSNAMRRVANYLGLVDDPEIASSVETSAARVPDVRIRTREARHVTSVSSTDAAPQLELPALDRIITLHPRFRSFSNAAASISGGSVS